MSSKRKADENFDETKSKRPYVYIVGGRSEDSKKSFNKVY